MLWIWRSIQNGADPVGARLARDSGAVVAQTDRIIVYREKLGLYPDYLYATELKYMLVRSYRFIV